MRYYLEQRDPDLAEKMAEVLCVYRQVKILKQAAAVSKEKKKPSDAVAIISYDEKPGIQAIATTAPDFSPTKWRAPPGHCWPMAAHIGRLSSWKPPKGARRGREEEDR